MSPCFTKFDNTPHFLIELSTDEYKSLEHCCIHISGIRWYKSMSSRKELYHTEFNSIRIGNGIQHNKESNIIHLNIDRSKRKLVLIVIDKEECSKCPQDVIILNTMLSMHK